MKVRSNALVFKIGKPGESTVFKANGIVIL